MAPMRGSFLLSLLLSLCLSFGQIESRGVSKNIEDTSDPLYPNAWNLHTTEIGTRSLNVAPVWQSNITGRGSTLLYSSRNPNILHHDLVGRYDSGASYLSTAEEDPEKTAIIAAAVGNAFNSVCSRGVAFNAKYALDGAFEMARDLLFLREIADIYVIDFQLSAIEDGSVNVNCPKCWENIETTVHKGGIVVSQTGNGGMADNCNYDNYANAPLTISVAAHTSSGDPSPFSESCANALVAGPGGDDKNPIPVAYGDESDCSTATGTHFAASQIAGVVALMQEASRRTLDYRAVAHILVESAHENPYGQENAAGFRHDYQLGFGSVNAGKAVAMAAGAIPYKYFESRWPLSVSKTVDQSIPSTTSVFFSIDMDSEPDILVDWVSVKVSITHPTPGDLEILLQSPSGTESELAVPRVRSGPQRKKIGVLSLFSDPSNPVVFALEGINGDAVEVGKDTVPYEATKAQFYRVSKYFDCCYPETCSLSIDPFKAKTGFKYILLISQEEANLNCELEEKLNNIEAIDRSIYQKPDLVFVESQPRITFLGIPVFGLDTQTARKFSLFEELEWSYQLTIESYYAKYSDLSFEDWSFTTARNWMEPVAGTWRLILSDEIPLDEGRLNSFELIFQTLKLLPEEQGPSPSHPPIGLCCHYASTDLKPIHSCIFASEECVLFHQTQLLESLYLSPAKCEQLCEGPFPSPSPTPFTPPTPTPTPTPTPVMPTPTPTPTPTSVPTPTPTPTPTPSPIAPLYNCCYYRATSEQFAPVCLSILEPCFRIQGYDLLSSLLSTEAECQSNCGGAPSPTPTPTPVTRELCCWYVSDATNEHRCLRLAESCPDIRHFFLISSLPAEERDCMLFCE